MGYFMLWKVDGGCRRNGCPDAIGAAAAVHQKRYGKHKCYRAKLPKRPQPASQRAEITAIILALRNSLEKYQELDGKPYLTVKIFTDSKYAFGCMTEWIERWRNNGWINSKNNEVKNKDLLKRAAKLQRRIETIGDVTYKWIPRDENELADEYCNDLLDEQDDSDSSS